MTFEQLKRYVADKYSHLIRPKATVGSDHIILRNVMYTDEGEVIFLDNNLFPYATSPRIREKISFDAMKQVIDGLYGDLANPVFAGAEDWKTENLRKS